MPLILSGNVASAIGGAYEVANSCRFDDGSSAYMHKTPGSAGDQQKFTFSFWIKRCGITTGTAMTIFDTEADDDNQFKIRFNDNGTLTVESKVSDHNDSLITNDLYRDPSAWMNFVIAFDTTQGTDTNRVKIYVNGTQITAFGTSNYPAQNLNTLVNAANKLYVGTSAQTDAYCDMYIAEFCLVDGSQLAATSFGEFDDDSPTIWKPKDVSGLTFGTNGFYLDFEDSGDLDDDESGNGNDWTAVNLASTDQMLDSPTNNFCVLNNLEAETATTSYAQGNLAGTTSNAARSTFAVNKGKWYWEHRFVNKEDMGGVMAYAKTDGSSWFAPNAYTINALIQGSNPELVLNGTEQSSWSGDGTPDALTDNQILNVALDCDNNRIAFGVNGAWLNNLDGSGEWSGTTLNYSNITTGYDYSPAFRTGSGTNRVSHMNFGSPFYTISSGNSDANGYGNFEYAVPSGFFSLCSKNLGQYG